MGIQFEKNESCVRLFFERNEKGLFSRFLSKTKEDIKSWSQTDQSLCFAIAELRVYKESHEDEVVFDKDVIHLSHAAVAALSENAATVLSLPPILPLIFEADIDGIVGQSSFRLRSQWSDGGGKVSCIRTGAFIETAKGQYRIPEPLYSAIEMAEGFDPQESDLPGHWEALAKFRSILHFDEEISEQDPTRRQRIKLTRILEEMQVYTASSFSLHIDDQENFSPVLFDDNMGAKAAEGELISENAGILDNRSQFLFQRDHRKGFTAFEKAKPTYSLGPNQYLIIDKKLLPALMIVREKQNASKKERRAFLENPAKDISTAVEQHLKVSGQLEGHEDIQSDQLVEQITASLFIETREYADRAKGLGIWESPNLSYIEQQSSHWMPETFGLQIGKKWVSLEVKETSDLQEIMEEGVRNNKKEVTFKSTNIECNLENLEKIMNLVSRIEPLSGRGGGPALDGVLRSKDGPVHAAILHDNFNETDWNPNIPKRTVCTSREVPSVVSATLMDHQKQSFDWMISAWESGLPGILNADDQGLGKTLQTLTFLTWLKANMNSADLAQRKPALIVAPTSLLKNWESETRKHLDSNALGILIKVYGSFLKGLKRDGSKGTDIIDGEEKLNFDNLMSAITKGNGHEFWVLTTYRTLANYQHSFRSVNFSVVIFDEIQNIKNPASFNSHSAKSVIADFRIGLTGTPIENHVVDLWSVIDSLAPGKLGALKKFASDYRKVTESRMSALYRCLFENTEKYPAIALRRMKEDVIGGLPRKDYLIHREDMPPEQVLAYDEIRSKLNDAAKGTAIKLLHHIRSVSLHPDRADANINDHVRFAEKSARLKTAINILENIKESNERALVFIEDHRMQWFFVELLKLSFGLEMVRVINGKTPIPRRMKYVDEFQEHLIKDDGFDVMVLSPKAAGIGLTLTAATHVIHLSRWWNPAVEEQCNDRIYRIGQQRDVTIHILMAVHPGYQDRSFDCILNDLIKRKKVLSKSVLWPPTNDDFDISQLMARLSGGEAKKLPDIDNFDPIKFEHWIGAEMQKNHEWKIFETPSWGDKGADAVFVNRHRRSYSVIIQAKHTSNPETVISRSAVEQVLRSSREYGLEKPILVVITNANKFTKSAVALAQKNHVILVPRSHLSLWPEHVLM